MKDKECPSLVSMKDKELAFRIWSTNNGSNFYKWTDHTFFFSQDSVVLLRVRRLSLQFQEIMEQILFDRIKQPPGYITFSAIRLPRKVLQNVFNTVSICHFLLQFICNVETF